MENICPGYQVRNCGSTSEKYRPLSFLPFSLSLFVLLSLFFLFLSPSLKKFCFSISFLSTFHLLSSLPLLPAMHTAPNPPHSRSALWARPMAGRRVSWGPRVWGPGLRQEAERGGVRGEEPCEEWLTQTGGWGQEGALGGLQGSFIPSPSRSFHPKAPRVNMLAHYLCDTIPQSKVKASAVLVFLQAVRENPSLPLPPASAALLEIFGLPWLLQLHPSLCLHLWASAWTSPCVCLCPCFLCLLAPRSYWIRAHTTLVWPHLTN